MVFDWTISECSSLDCTLRISWCMLRCHIHLRFWHARLLMIDLIALLSVLILILAWLFCSLHMHRLTIVHRLTCCVVFSDLHIILIIFEHDVCITIHLDCCILAYLVCTWWYIWALPDCVLHDCPSLRDCMSLVHVGRTSIPLPPNLLVSVIPFISVLTIASVRPSVCLLSDQVRD